MDSLILMGYVSFARWVSLPSISNKERRTCMVISIYIRKYPAISINITTSISMFIQYQYQYVYHVFCILICISISKWCQYINISIHPGVFGVLMNWPLIPVLKKSRCKWCQWLGCIRSWLCLHQNKAWCFPTRSAPTSYKWSHSPYKWPKINGFACSYGPLLFAWSHNPMF